MSYGKEGSTQAKTAKLFSVSLSLFGTAFSDHDKTDRKIYPVDFTNEISWQHPSQLYVIFDRKIMSPKYDPSQLHDS